MFASRAKVAWGGSLWSTAWFIPSCVLLGSPMEHCMAMVHSSDVSQWFSKKEERRIGVGVWLTGGKKWMELGIQFISPYEPNSHFPWCQNKNQVGCTDNLSISDLRFLSDSIWRFTLETTWSLLRMLGERILQLLAIKEKTIEVFGNIVNFEDNDNITNRNYLAF